MQTLQMAWTVLLGALLVACGSAPTPPSDPSQSPGRARYTFDDGLIVVDTRQPDCTVVLSGDIGTAAVRKLSQVLPGVEQAPCRNKTLVLGTLTGVVGDAVTLGSMVRNRHYDTELTPGSVCSTPCLLVFAAGQTRTMPQTPSPAQLAFTPLPPDADFGQGQCRPEWSRGQQLTLARYLRAMLPGPSANAVYQKLQDADCRTSEHYGSAAALGIGLATRVR